MQPAELLQPVAPPQTPELRAIGIATINGSATVDGRSHALGNEFDAALLMELRAWSDAVLVGAQTVRQEGYGPITLQDSQRAARRSRGQEEVPQLVVLSRSGRLPRSLGDARPLMLREGPLQRGLATLRKRGYHRIVCEGGPSVYGQLLAEDLIDVVHLTIDPRIALPVEKPLFETRNSHVLRKFRAEKPHITDDGTVFLTYRRRIVRGASSAGTVDV